MYDIGGQIIDIQGNIYEEFSFVIRDIFCKERELMHSAYYGYKIPEYVNDIQQNKRKMINFLDARGYILNLMYKYNCYTVAAYNCSFDKRALNVTLRYLSKSRYRWFFPRATKFICVWNMACNTICQRQSYKTFAETNRYYSNHGKNYRATAEAVYSYLINNPDFNEEHKGLDDVNIERQIMIECLNSGGELLGIKRNCWQKVQRRAIMLYA